MPFIHEATLRDSDLEIYKLNIRKPTAKDRRGVIRMLYGDWFESNKLKLSRDYLVHFISLPVDINLGNFQLPKKMACITILDPKVAMLFKLTWG